MNDASVLMRGSAVKDDVIQWDIDWGATVIGAGNRGRYSHRLNIGRGWVVIDIETFIGLDRGHVGEMDFNVFDRKNRCIYRRSLHKETSGIYDSIHNKTMNWNPEGEIYIEARAWPTTEESIKWHPAILITLEREEE